MARDDEPEFHIPLEATVPSLVEKRPASEPPREVHHELVAAPKVTSAPMLAPQTVHTQVAAEGEGSVARDDDEPEFRIPLEATSPGLVEVRRAPEPPRDVHQALVATSNLTSALPPASAPAPMTAQAPAASGLSQMFGIDPRAAVLFVIVDLLMFGEEVATLGLGIIIAPFVAAAVGFITYKIQRAWFLDTHESALIKSLIVGLLTAIPAPVTPIIAVPGGIAGMIQLARRKRAAA